MDRISTQNAVITLFIHAEMSALVGVVELVRTSNLELVCGCCLFVVAVFLGLDFLDGSFAGVVLHGNNIEVVVDKPQVAAVLVGGIGYAVVGLQRRVALGIGSYIALALGHVNIV